MQLRYILVPIFTGLMWAGAIPPERAWTSLIFALALLAMVALTLSAERK